MHDIVNMMYRHFLTKDECSPLLDDMESEEQQFSSLIKKSKSPISDSGSVANIKMAEWRGLMISKNLNLMHVEMFLSQNQSHSL